MDGDIASVVANLKEQQFGSGLTAQFGVLLFVVWGGLLYLLIKLFRSQSWWSVLVLAAASLTRALTNQSLSLPAERVARSVVR